MLLEIMELSSLSHFQEDKILNGPFEIIEVIDTSKEALFLSIEQLNFGAAYSIKFSISIYEGNYKNHLFF